MAQNNLRFLSLFVPNLEAAKTMYTSVFGAASEAPNGFMPLKHPFSPKEPVLLELGETRLALYQVDGRTTHPGDVGIGIVTDDPESVLAGVTASGGQLLVGPHAVRTQEGERSLWVFVLPTRHFFELIGPA